MVTVSREGIRRNVEEIRLLTARAAARAGRDPEDISIVGVSKFQPIEAIYAAVDCGVTLLGENRVQEREEKSAAWAGGPAVWHMLGHLQRNKARKALELFDCIQSVDSYDLASTLERIIKERIDGGGCDAGRRYPILIEVNASGEDSKSGVDPDGCLGLVERITDGCPHLGIDGLMTIGPLNGGEAETRASFALLRRLGAFITERAGIMIDQLSMGMSGDFEAAIEEGSTMVRVGTGIFGARRG
jgi:pyridoxal phosphate enzyme (YggS family)